MGFKYSDATNVNYVKLDDLNKNMELIAKYTGKTESVNYPGTYTYFFVSTTDEGNEEKIGVPSCADLNRKMGFVAEGSDLKIVYKGKRKFETSKGVAEGHSFWIELLENGKSTPIIVNGKGELVGDAADIAEEATA